MRVVAGSAKGRRLAPVPAGTRPVADRAREGLFSSLGEAVLGATVLDLFAGTGALGIEALSRGAERATFVDSSAQAVRTVRENLERTDLADRATVHRRDVLRFLRGTPDPVTLAFLDPPYATASDSLAEVLAALAAGWLAPGATGVLTRPSRGYKPVIPVNWLVTRRLNYGDSLVILFREV